MYISKLLSNSSILTMMAVAWMQISVSNKKNSDWQASLRQFGMSHNACVPSKEIVDGALGLTSLDLSYNQFTDDLADELCPILYGEAPLSALHLQCNQLTREGAKTFGAVMKERRVLQLVDLRNNKQEVSTTTPNSADAVVAVAAAKSIPCPKEACRSSQQTMDPNPRRPTVDKYRKIFLAKPKFVGKKQITGGGTVSQKSKTSSETVDLSSSPGVLVEINKLPLRPKSAPERLPKSLVGTPRIVRQSNLTKSFTVRRALDCKHEFPCQRMSNNHRDFRCKQGHDLTRPTSRPKSAPDRVRTPLCPARKTPRGKAHHVKNSGSGGSVPGSARKSQKSLADEIAPWEQLVSRDEDVTSTEHPCSPSPSNNNTESERKSDTSAQEEQGIRRKPGRKLKKRKSRNPNPQFPCNSGKATYRTVTSLVPLLGQKNMQTSCPEKQKRKPKIKPNVVKRRELLFQNGIEATAEAVHEISLSGEAAVEVPGTTPGVDSNEQLKEPFPGPIAATEEDSQWNSFMSEMTKTLLNINARLPHLPEIVHTEV